jgi:hypothetical protein
MLNILKINALVELDRFGWDAVPSGQDEVKCKCPVHEDQVASCSLNVVKNVWICHASHCRAHGDIIALLAYIVKKERKTIIVELQTRYPGLAGKKIIKPDRIEEWHNAVWNSGPYLQELYKRGVTDEEIREQKIGYSQKEKRIMIPVFDKEHQVVNVRKYKPGAPGPDKVRNISGYKSRAIYLIDQLKYPTLWICGGELKALVSKRFLNPSDVGAICYTGAEGAWHESLTPELKDKIVFICMDVDAGGREGARRLAAQIYSQVKAVYIINLGLFLDITKYPKGDINDWVGKENAKESDFASAMKMSTEYVPPYFKEQDEENIPSIQCSLLEARKSETVNKKIETSFVINMLDTENYLVPKELSISCIRDASCCGVCIVNSKKVDDKTGLVNITLQPMNQEFLGLIGISQKNKSMNIALLDAMGIPECKSAKIKIESYYNVADVRLGTEMDLESNSGKTDLNQPAFIVGLTEEQIELNIPYVGTGRNYPDPAKGSSVLLINKLERKEDSLSSFNLGEEDYKLLTIFQV